MNYWNGTKVSTQFNTNTNKLGVEVRYIKCFVRCFCFCLVGARSFESEREQKKKFKFPEMNVSKFITIKAREEKLNFPSFLFQDSHAPQVMWIEPAFHCNFRRSCYMRFFTFTLGVLMIKVSWFPFFRFELFFSVFSFNFFLEIVKRTNLVFSIRNTWVHTSLAPEWLHNFFLSMFSLSREFNVFKTN